MRYFLLLLVGLIWGSQYVLNDIVLQSFSPFALTSIRMFIGFLTLTLLIILIPSERKQQLNLDKKLFKLLLVLGLAESTIPFSFIAFGQTLISSSMAAIILGTIPMITLLIHSFVLKEHKVTGLEIAGMVLAFIGLIILINPSSEAFSGSIYGYIFLFIAATSFAISIILMDKIPHHLSAMHVSRFVLMVYSIPYLIFYLLSNGFPVTAQMQDWFYLLLLGVFSSGFIYVIYIKLVRLAGPTFTSLSNYLVPVTGTLLGVFILNDPLNFNIISALILISISLFIINYKKKA